MDFTVSKMSCGHCVASIEKAIKAVDPTASVTCDLDSHRVSVSGVLSGNAVSEAIKTAGYDPEPVAG